MRRRLLILSQERNALMRQISRPWARRRYSKTLIILTIAACILAVGTACGGGSSSTTGTVGITISPTSVTLPVAASQQFSAVVSNTTNTTVTWQVNGTTGGSATYGIISTAGVYTAPTTLPTGTVTVTAISSADTSKTATATVTITSANTLVISPAQVTVPAGAQQTFTSSLGNAAVATSWSVSCGDATAGACGTIDGTGVYTAPLSPPAGQTVTVFAKSSNNIATAANANVIITYGTGTLSGPYSFELTGVRAGQSFSSVGSVTFDGQGKITGGTADLPGQTTPITITGGTYTCDVTGRVTATLQTTSGSQGWEIALINHARSFVTRVDGVVVHGDLQLQDSTRLGSNLGGSLSLHLAGTSTGHTSPIAGQVGALTVDPNGNITSGVLDVNDGGTVSTAISVSGSATASTATTGRGTLTLTSAFGAQQLFAYYLIDAYTANLVQIGGGHDFVGKVVWRAPNTTINAQYYMGSYGFVFPGANASGLMAQGGTFSVDASGNISNGTLDTSSDSAYSLGYLFSGLFTVTDPTTGRATVNFNVGASTYHYVVYPPDTNANLTFLGIDTGNVVLGPADSSQSVVTGSAIPALSGNFAVQSAETSSSVARNLTGGLVLSALAPSGWLDVINNGNISLDTPLQSSTFSITSLYGRGTLHLQAGTYSASYTTYLVNGDAVLLMQTDGNGVQTGAIQKRY